MIYSPAIDEAFKHVQLDSFSIEDDTSGLSILLNSYRGDTAFGARRDYFIGIWEAAALSPLIPEMIEIALSIHRNLADEAQFPISRLLFDLHWFDGRKQATKVDQDLDSVMASLPELIIEQNRFVRLDGQFFGLVMDGLTNRKMTSSSSRESHAFVSVTSMFNIIESLVLLHQFSFLSSQRRLARQFPDYTRFSQDIRSTLLDRFPHWTRITELHGQLDGLHP